jgi:antitoxin VapB
LKIIEIFKPPLSQFGCLPAPFHFAGEAVAVKHAGNGMLLLHINDPWRIMQQALDEFEPGFKLAREQQC